MPKTPPKQIGVFGGPTVPSTIPTLNRERPPAMPFISWLLFSKKRHKDPAFGPWDRSRPPACRMPPTLHTAGTCCICRANENQVRWTTERRDAPGIVCASRQRSSTREENAFRCVGEIHPASVVGSLSRYDDDYRTGFSFGQDLTGVICRQHLRRFVNGDFIHNAIPTDSMQNIGCTEV